MIRLLLSSVYLSATAQTISYFPAACKDLVAAEGLNCSVDPGFEDECIGKLKDICDVSYSEPVKEISAEKCPDGSTYSITQDSAILDGAQVIGSDKSGQLIGSLKITTASTPPSPCTFDLGPVTKKCDNIGNTVTTLDMSLSKADVEGLYWSEYYTIDTSNCPGLPADSILSGDLGFSTTFNGAVETLDLVSSPGSPVVLNECELCTAPVTTFDDVLECLRKYKATDPCYISLPRKLEGNFDHDSHLKSACAKGVGMTFEHPALDFWAKHGIRKESPEISGIVVFTDNNNKAISLDNCEVQAPRDLECKDSDPVNLPGSYFHEDSTFVEFDAAHLTAFFMGPDTCDAHQDAGYIEMTILETLSGIKEEVVINQMYKVVDADNTVVDDLSGLNVGTRCTLDSSAGETQIALCLTVLPTEYALQTSREVTGVDTSFVIESDMTDAESLFLIPMEMYGITSGVSGTGTINFQFVTEDDSESDDSESKDSSCTAYWTMYPESTTIGSVKIEHLTAMVDLDSNDYIFPFSLESYPVHSNTKLTILIKCKASLQRVVVEDGIKSVSLLVGTEQGRYQKPAIGKPILKPDGDGCKCAEDASHQLCVTSLPASCAIEAEYDVGGIEIVQPDKFCDEMIANVDIDAIYVTDNAQVSGKITLSFELGEDASTCSYDLYRLDTYKCTDPDTSNQVQSGLVATGTTVTTSPITDLKRPLVFYLKTSDENCRRKIIKVEYGEGSSLTTSDTGAKTETTPGTIQESSNFRLKGGSCQTSCDGNSGVIDVRQIWACLTQASETCSYLWDHTIKGSSSPTCTDAPFSTSIAALFPNMGQWVTDDDNMPLTGTLTVVFETAATGECSFVYGYTNEVCSDTIAETMKATDGQGDAKVTLVAGSHSVDVPIEALVKVSPYFGWTFVMQSNPSEAGTCGTKIREIRYEAQGTATALGVQDLLVYPTSTPDSPPSGALANISFAMCLLTLYITAATL